MIFWYCGKTGGGATFKSFALARIHTDIRDYFLLTGKQKFGKIPPVPGCLRGLGTTSQRK